MANLPFCTSDWETVQFPHAKRGNADSVSKTRCNVEVVCVQIAFLEKNLKFYLKHIRQRNKDTACLMPEKCGCLLLWYFMSLSDFCVTNWPGVGQRWKQHHQKATCKKCKLWSKTNGRKSSLNDGVANCNVLFPSSINQQSDLLVVQGDTALPSKAKLILSACFKEC